MDEIARLAEQVAALAAQLARLQDMARIGMTLMDMTYYEGYEEGRGHRPPRRPVRAPGVERRRNPFKVVRP